MAEVREREAGEWAEWRIAWREARTRNQVRQARALAGGCRGERAECERGTCLDVNRRTKSERQAGRRGRARCVREAVSDTDVSVSDTTVSYSVRYRPIPSDTVQSARLRTSRSH